MKFVLTRQGESPALSLHEAQRVAESIVGAVSWRGSDGFCACPGAHRHTTPNALTDCKVVCASLPVAGGELAPGLYCFHGSCQAEVDAASFELRSALGKRCPSGGDRPRLQSLPARTPKPVFDPVKLEALANKLSGVDATWLAVRSAKQVGNRTPASFLHELYRPGERVLIFDSFKSQGQHVWTHRQPPFDARELDSFRNGKLNGVWFLCNPVSGEAVDDDRGKPTRRSWRTVTAWRYLVLESDRAHPGHWLSAVAQLPLPIAAIYTSGGKSIHALVRLDAGSKQEWDTKAGELKAALVTWGADPKAMSAVRLTRLPCCQRLGSEDPSGRHVPFSLPRTQELLYLNGGPDGTPICEQPLRP